MKDNQFVTVSVFLKRGERALVLQRSKNSRFLPSYWEQAGGKVEKGEHPYEAAKREVMEETGLNVKIKNPYYINFYSMEDGRDMIEIALLGEIMDELQIVISNEHEMFRWVSFNELSELAPLSDGMRGVIERGFRESA